MLEAQIPLTVLWTLGRKDCFPPVSVSIDVRLTSHESFDNFVTDGRVSGIKNQNINAASRATDAILICGRPARCKRFLKKLARSRMLPSVRPLMQRWSCGPVWEFADWNQIINACSGHDEYIWFFQPRLADCCAIPSFDRLHL
jgi:NAD(P)H-flavin reductase